MGKRGMLSEITSKDAYARFYQGKIPQDFYEQVMLNAPQMTPLHKLTLDHLAAAIASGAYKECLQLALQISDFWSKADNESRQYVVRICKDDEGDLKNYDVFKRVMTEIMSMKTHSEGSYNLRGLEVFYNDDNVCVTCTKSYAASVKNFGRSHWCTASDQFGEYDGFEMFKNYTRDGILVQFYCKQDEDHSFQVQYVQMGRKIVPGAICDWEDDTMDVESVEKMLAAYNVSYKNIMKTVRANFKRLRAETLELRKDEEIYWSRKRDERVKNILKGIKKATSSNECIEFAKRVFKAKKYMRSADGVYGGSVMNDSDAVKTPLTYVYVFYEGKNQAEKDFLRWYFEDEGYEDAYYDVLNTAVFVFDKAGNIVNKYDGCAPIFMGTLMYITTMEDEGLYEGRTLYIVNIKTGKPIFSNPYGALGADDSQNYLEDIEDEMIEKVGRRCNIEDWFVVSPENGKAVAINYKNAKMVEITFESYMF